MSGESKSTSVRTRDVCDAMPSEVCPARNADQQEGKCVCLLYATIAIRQNQIHQTVSDRSIRDIRRPKTKAPRQTSSVRSCKALFHSLTRMVVAAVSELMNMRSFYNAAAVNSYETVTSKRTCVEICGDDG